MAKGYIFVLVNCKKQNAILVTHSAQVAMKYLEQGFRVDVWRTNRKVRIIYAKDKYKLFSYIKEDEEWIKANKEGNDETV